MFLTFEGTRDAKVRDRDTRIRVALADVQAARLWRLLGEQLSDAERRATEWIGLVGTYLEARESPTNPIVVVTMEACRRCVPGGRRCYIRKTGVQRN